MKKILTFLLSATLSVGIGWAETTTLAAPVIYPESDVYEVGEIVQGAYIETNEGCPIGTYTVFTIDGSTPMVTVNEKDGTFEVGEGTISIGPKDEEEVHNLDDISVTTAITAFSFYFGSDTVIYSDTVSTLYTFISSNGLKYELLTGAPNEDAFYVIVNKEHDRAMSTEQGDTHRSATGVNFVEGTSKHWVQGNTSLAQFRIKKDGDYYTLYNANGENVGYLSVNTNDQDNLLTNETTQQATITIGDTVTTGDDDYNINHSYAASIVFNHEGTARTMRLCNPFYFSTYDDATLNEEVFLYGTTATPLTTIEQIFDQNDEVTISDQLIGVWAIDNLHLLWAKDKSPYPSIDPTDIAPGQTDYMRDVTGLQTTDWDQQNWVLLDLSSLSDVQASSYVNKYIPAGSITGIYTGSENYTIKVTAIGDPEEPSTDLHYPGNINDPKEEEEVNQAYNNYMAANFLRENTNWGEYVGTLPGANMDEDLDYMPMFFMNPKVMEVVQIHSAVWNEEGSFFTMPEVELPSINPYDLKGAFQVDWSYNIDPDNNEANYIPELVSNHAYTFHAVVMRDLSEGDYGYKKMKAQNTDCDKVFKIFPLDLYPEKADISITTLDKLVASGIEGQFYNISNKLYAVKVAWDENQQQFAIFAKDDNEYADKSAPIDGQSSYLITYDDNKVEQKDYDQSNWLEILLPSDLTNVQSKTADDTQYATGYEEKLKSLCDTYEGKILTAMTVGGTYVDALNPTLQANVLPEAGDAASYTENIYCTANFLVSQLNVIDNPVGAKTGELYNEAFNNSMTFFMMDAKPQEVCKVVWAYYEGADNYFVMPAREETENGVINFYDLDGSLYVDMSMCSSSKQTDGESIITKNSSAASCYSPSGNSDPAKLYGFNVIVRKNPESSLWNPSSDNAPRRVSASGSASRESVPAYIVYPLEGEGDSKDTVTGLQTLLNSNKQAVSVRYYNLTGTESATPFDGLNIVVTRYNDGSTRATKLLH